MLENLNILLQKNVFLKSTAIVFAATFLVNVLNYVFTVFTARFMSVESYGEIASIFSLLLIFSVPAGGLGLHVIREVAQKYDNKESLEIFKQKIFKEVFLLSTFLFLIFLALIPFISNALSLPKTHLLLFSLLLPLGIVGSYHGSFFQGAHKFFTSSILSVSATVAKLLFAIVFLYLGFDVLGVVLALVLASLINLFISTEAFRGVKNIFASGPKVKFNDLFIHIFSITFFAMLFLSILSNVDVLLAKYFLNAYDAGSYAAISTLGKIVIFATGAFVTVMLPLVSKDQNHKTFLTSFVFMSAGGILIVIFFFLFSPYIVHALFGLKYEGIIGYVPYFSLAMFFVALSTALVNYFLAVKNKSFLYFLSAGILAELMILLYNHGSINEFVFSILTSSIILFILLVLNLFFLRNTK